MTAPTDTPEAPNDGLVAEFPVIAMGHGLIEVGDAMWEGLPALWFGNEGQGLGVERVRDNGAKDGETLMLVTFTNIEGLEAIEKAVSRLRATITGIPLAAASAASLVAEPEPIDMVLHCPKCGLQHVDAEESTKWDTGPRRFEGSGFTQWDNPPHRSHLCHGCGYIWRPADVATNGVSAVKTKGKNDSPLAAPLPASPAQPVVAAQEPVKSDPDRVKAERDAGYWRALTCAIATRGAKLEIVEHRGRRTWDCTFGGTTARARTSPEAALHSAIMLEFDGNVPETFGLPKSTATKLVHSAAASKVEAPVARTEVEALTRELSSSELREAWWRATHPHLYAGFVDPGTATHKAEPPASGLRAETDAGGESGRGLGSMDQLP